MKHWVKSVDLEVKWAMGLFFASAKVSGKPAMGVLSLSKDDLLLSA